MKKKILFIILTIAIAVLSIQVQFFEFYMIGLISLCLLCIAVTGVINIFKKPNRKIYKFSLITIAICLVGVIASLFRPYEEAILQSGTIGEKLQYAYKTDQNDRMQLKSFLNFSNEFQERDRARLTQVNEVLEQGEPIEPIEKFYAAFIYHHSNNSKDYETASKLAAAAAEEESLKANYQVQWLKKASYDRWMVSIGKPEKYNTQNKLSLEFE